MEQNYVTVTVCIDDKYMTTNFIEHTCSLEGLNC